MRQIDYSDKWFKKNKQNCLFIEGCSHRIDLAPSLHRETIQTLQSQGSSVPLRTQTGGRLIPLFTLFTCFYLQVTSTSQLGAFLTNTSLHSFAADVETQDTTSRAKGLHGFSWWVKKHWMLVQKPTGQALSALCQTGIFLFPSQSTDKA